MVADTSTSGRIPATTVAEAIAGDAMAFARIVRAHHDDMARVCHVICGDVDLAQDATQAAWPIVWRKLGTLRDPETLRPWLVSVAANDPPARPPAPSRPGRLDRPRRCRLEHRRSRLAILG